MVIATRSISGVASGIHTVLLAVALLSTLLVVSAAAQEKEVGGPAYERRERVKRSLADRHSAMMDEQESMLRSRRARRSCVADFKKLCDGAAAAGKDDKRQQAAIGGGSRRFHSSFAALDACLGERVDQIQNDNCKAYITGRNACITDAEQSGKCPQVKKDSEQKKDASGLRQRSRDIARCLAEQPADGLSKACAASVFYKGIPTRKA